MLFSSLTFLYIFLPTLLFFYIIIRNSGYRKYVLLIFSLIFYACGEPIYILLLIGLAVVNFILSLAIERHSGIFKNFLFILIILIDLLTLIYFKYINLIIETLNLLLSTDIALINVTLPLGISFFTFQIISYVADVMKGTVPAQKDLINLLLYISFFPQLIAGPIVRYSDICYQLENRKFVAISFIRGLYRFSVGLFKKVVFANSFGLISTNLFKIELTRISVTSFWLGISLFTLQIYFDFSGYSDMAIGLSKIFGFDLPENFDYPYCAVSIKEYWRKWHISLSSFFRDYVYIPLGGKYKHHIINLFIVWFLTGLWHGAAYNFIIWGLFYFVLVLLEELIFARIANIIPKRISNIFGHLFVIFLTIIAWNIFYWVDIDKLILSFKVMFLINKNPLHDIISISILRENAILIFVGILSVTPLFKRLFDMFIKKMNVEVISKTIAIIILFAISTMLLVGESYNPFLYFRF